MAKVPRASPKQRKFILDLREKVGIDIFNLIVDRLKIRDPFHKKFNLEDASDLIEAMLECTRKPAMLRQYQDQIAIEGRYETPSSDNLIADMQAGLAKLVDKLQKDPKYWQKKGDR